MRAVGAIAASLVIVAVLLVAAGVALPPLARTCAPTVDEDRCAETVVASLSRGLPRLHPVILGAHVEAGPAAAEGALGHRATVTFDLLGVPGATSVRLYLDMGGHWGGEVDRSDAEVAAWAILPLLLAAGGAIALVGVALRRRDAG
jgi:hypothetical protein